MKIISWNINGLRSVYKKGFVQWLLESEADIVCLQEVKVNADQLTIDLLEPAGYCSYFNSAIKKGYSGVAVYTKKKPQEIRTSLGINRFDDEGRLLRLDYADFSLLNVYMPHGGRKKENLNYKLEIYTALINYLKRAQCKKVIVVGDFNVAHKEIDLARPKNNRNNIMFTDKERLKIDELLDLGFLDAFRLFFDTNGYYSWFPYGFNARKRNLGWRIDYTFVLEKLKSEIINAYILKDVDMSDHCPILLEIGL